MNSELLLDVAKHTDVNQTLRQQVVTISKFSLKEKLTGQDLSPAQQEFIVFCQEIIDRSQISEEKLLQLEHDKFIEICQKDETIKKLEKFARECSHDIAAQRAIHLI